MSGQLSLFGQQQKQNKRETNLMQNLNVIAVNKDRPSAKLLDLLPIDAVLEVNKHYEIQEIHVSRILKMLQETGEIISREEIGRRLSMTKARAEGITNVMRKMELLDNISVPSPLGSLVIAYCPYLDDAGLLWLLHYLLASNAQLVLWSNLFNFILHEREEVSIRDILEFFQTLQGRWSVKSIKDKLPKEINAILKTYTQALFGRLGLIQKVSKANYVCLTTTSLIPSYIWLSTILVYRDRYYPGAASLEVPLIVNGHFSPGRILHQDEASIRKALDMLHNINLITVETRSGLDQVRFKREHTWLSIVNKYLQGEPSP